MSAEKRKEIIISFQYVYEEGLPKSIFDVTNAWYAKKEGRLETENKKSVPLVRIEFDAQKGFFLNDEYNVLSTIDNNIEIKLYGHGSSKMSKYLSAKSEIFSSSLSEAEENGEVISSDNLANLIVAGIKSKSSLNLNRILEDNRVLFTLNVCGGAINKNGETKFSFADYFHKALQANGWTVDLIAYPFEKVTKEGVDKYYMNNRMLFTWGPKSTQKISKIQHDTYKPQTINLVLVCANKLITELEEYEKNHPEENFTQTLNNQCETLHDIEDLLSKMPKMNKSLHNSYLALCDLNKDFKNINFKNTGLQKVYFIMYALGEQADRPFTLDSIKFFLQHNTCPGYFKKSQLAQLRLVTEILLKIAKMPYTKFLVNITFSIEDIEIFFKRNKYKEMLLGEQDLSSLHDWGVTAIGGSDKIIVNSLFNEKNLFKGIVIEELEDPAAEKINPLVSNLHFFEDLSSTTDDSISDNTSTSESNDFTNTNYKANLGFCNIL